MKIKYTTLLSYLNYYYSEIQKEIILVYRETPEQSWAKRCMYLGDKFSPKMSYNHRSILDREVVIEYDTEDKELNRFLASKVVEKLRKDKIRYAIWDSGNKSSHIHFILKDYKVSNLGLFKNVVMRHYGTFWVKDKDIIDFEKEGYTKVVPDLRLSVKGHLIRAEYGIHEKSQERKSLITKSPEYPCISNISVDVFDKYQKAQEKSVYQRIAQKTSDLNIDHDLVRKLLDSVQFRKDMDDGRERVMFALIHILKPKYTNKEELVDFLWEWYCYSSSQGNKMTKTDVNQKVNYHFNRNYVITENYLKRIIEEIGGNI